MEVKEVSMLININVDTVIDKYIDIDTDAVTDKYRDISSKCIYLIHFYINLLYLLCTLIKKTRMDWNWVVNII